MVLCCLPSKSIVLWVTDILMLKTSRSHFLFQQTMRANYRLACVSRKYLFCKSMSGMTQLGLQRTKKATRTQIWVQQLQNSLFWVVKLSLLFEIELDASASVKKQDLGHRKIAQNLSLAVILYGTFTDVFLRPSCLVEDMPRCICTKKNFFGEIWSRLTFQVLNEISQKTSHKSQRKDWSFAFLQMNNKSNCFWVDLNFTLQMQTQHQCWMFQWCWHFSGRGICLFLQELRTSSTHTHHFAQ